MKRERLSLIVVATVIILGVAAMVYFQDSESSDDLDSNSVELIEDSPQKVNRTSDETAEMGAEESTDVGEVPGPGVGLAPARADSCHVVGRVVDQEKKPVPDAIVALCLDISDFRSRGHVSKVLTHQISDENGEFQLPNVHVGEVYTLRVESPDFASKYVTGLQLVAGSTKTYEVIMHPGITIKGLVTDLSDLPIAGARVFVMDLGMKVTDKLGGVERETITGPDGRFLVKNLNQGFKNVGASMAAHATRQQFNFHVHHSSAKHDLVFKLGPGKAMMGLVVDEDDVPVSGVEVTAQPIDLRSNKFEKRFQTVRSDDEGRFNFGGLKTGDYYLTCKKLGYYPSLSRNLARPGEREQTIRLKQNPIIRGHVIDAETQEPVTKFTLYSTPRKSILFVSENAKQKFESEDGSFAFRCLRNTGDVFLHLESGNHAAGFSKKIVLSQQKSVEGIVVEAIAGATAVGRVVDMDGNPIANANVEMETIPDGTEGLGKLGSMVYGKLALLQRKASTGKDGKFRISRLRPAKYRLVIKHGAHAMNRGDQLREVTKSGEFPLGDLVLLKGGNLSGVVFDKDNSTMAGVLVKLVPEDPRLTGGFDLETKTDESGGFELKHLSAGGYRLQIIRTARLAQLAGQLPNLPTARFMTVFVEDGADKKIEVRGL